MNKQSKLEKQLDFYRKFTNNIDDYFEYRARNPEESRKYVQSELKKLTEQLSSVLTSSKPMS